MASQRWDLQFRSKQSDGFTGYFHRIFSPTKNYDTRRYPALFNTTVRLVWKSANYKKHLHALFVPTGVNRHTSFKIMTQGITCFNLFLFYIRIWERGYDKTAEVRETRNTDGSTSSKKISIRTERAKDGNERKMAKSSSLDKSACRSGSSYGQLDWIPYTVDSSGYHPDEGVAGEVSS